MAHINNLDKGYTIPYLDKGFVRYIDHMGTDQRICECARISYKAPSKGPEQDKKLLNYLYKMGHSSPFEQCNITFNIKMPIFVMRQFVRHRTFRLNEVSARYTKLSSDFYIPDEWRIQDTKNRQGSLSSKHLNHEELSSNLLNKCTECYSLYEDMIDQGVARELARMILPTNIYTEIYVNCDLHNLMHFLNLRIDSHAQLEIQELAKKMHHIMNILFPWTTEVFDKYKLQMTEIIPKLQETKKDLFDK